MNKKGGIIADVLLILLGFVAGTFFGKYVYDLVIKLLNTKFQLI